MIAVENYRTNFNIWGEDYLHYYIDHAQQVYEWVKSKASLTRSQNTIGLRSSAASRVNRLKKQMMQTQDEALIDELISGKMFKEMESISETNIVNNAVNAPGFEEASEIISSIDSNVSTLGDFSIALRNAMDAIYGKDYMDKLISEYAASLVQEYADENNLRTKNSTAKSIINSLLGKYNHKFFKTKAQDASVPSQQVHVDCMKILALIQTLPDVNLGKGKFEVRHGSQAKGTGTKVQGESAVLEELKKKVLNYFGEMQKMTMEAALAAGLNAANHVGLKALLEDGGRVIQAGNSYHETGFDIDPKLKNMYQQTTIDMQRTQKKKNKGDVEFQIAIGEDGNGTVTANAGISVKDYKNLNIQQMADGTFSLSGEIKLQEGTPFLTALAREANISSNDIQKIVQFAVAHSLSGDDYSLDTTWEDLKNNITQRMFLNALASLNKTKDNVIFMAINGKIFTIENIVDSFIRSANSNLKIQEYLGQSNEKTPEQGLERNTYVSMNR